MLPAKQSRPRRQRRPDTCRPTVQHEEGSDEVARVPPPPADVWAKPRPSPGPADHVHLGGAEIWAKREDISSGLAYGGNKVRKLECFGCGRARCCAGVNTSTPQQSRLRSAAPCEWPAFSRYLPISCVHPTARSPSYIGPAPRWPGVQHLFLGAMRAGAGTTSPIARSVCGTNRPGNRPG